METTRGSATACALPEVSSLLTAAWLTSRFFEFRAGPQKVLIASSLRFEPDGRIGGYCHPNEAAWRIEDGRLVVLCADGTPSCIATPTRTDNGTVSFVGSFLLAPGDFVHSFDDSRVPIPRAPIENQFILSENAANGISDSCLRHFIPATFAQCGEDIIVSAIIFAHLTKTRRPWESVFYIEIGANHPISTSNTYLLYQRYGGSGVLVEPNPDLHGAISTVRPRDTLVAAAVLPEPKSDARLYIGNAHELSSLSSEHIESFGKFDGAGGIRVHLDVAAIGINDLLKQYAGDRDIDFLSIDCEGLDYDLVQAMDLELYRPLVIQCEPSEHALPGNTAKLIELLESRSYRLVARTDVNLIFLRS